MTGPGQRNRVMRGVLLTLAMPPTGFVVLIVIGLLLRGGWRRFGRRLTWVVAGRTDPVRHARRVLQPAAGAGNRPADDARRPIIRRRRSSCSAARSSARRTRRLGIRPGLLTLDRLRTAAALHRRTGLPILVTGGTTQPETPAVGLVMAAKPAGRFPDAGALGRGEIRRYLGKCPLQRRHPARRGHHLGLCRDPCLAHAAGGAWLSRAPA